MSDFELKPHKFFRVTISSFKYAKNTIADTIALHVYNNSPYKITLHLGILGYCEKRATFHPTQEKAYRVNNILKLLDICPSTILDEELSNSVITIASKKQIIS